MHPHLLSTGLRKKNVDESMSLKPLTDYSNKAD